MKNVFCRILGHQEFGPEVLAARPWDDPDFAEYSISAFMEDRCLRCGEPLTPEAQAA